MSGPGDAVQEALDLVFGGGLCRWGAPPGGTIGRCTERATHRARWRKLGVFFLKTGPEPYRLPDDRPTEGGVDCCVEHANYYADAWAYTHVVLYPHIGEETWIEIL